MTNPTDEEMIAWLENTRKKMLAGLFIPQAPSMCIAIRNRLEALIPKGNIGGGHSNEETITLPQTTNFTPEQIEEIEAMITNRLVTFHDHLIVENQISAPSGNKTIRSNSPPNPKLEVVKSED